MDATYSFLFFLGIGGVGAVIALICLPYAAYVTWKLASKNTRSAALPQFRFALFGGVFLTSAPFDLLCLVLLGQHHYILVSENLFAIYAIAGVDRQNFRWIPFFVLGYALFAFLWAVYFRLRKSEQKAEFDRQAEK